MIRLVTACDDLYDTYKALILKNRPMVEDITTKWVKPQIQLHECSLLSPTECFSEYMDVCRCGYLFLYSWEVQSSLCQKARQAKSLSLYEIETFTDIFFLLIM